MNMAKRPVPRYDFMAFGEAIKAARKTGKKYAMKCLFHRATLRILRTRGSTSVYRYSLSLCSAIIYPCRIFQYRVARCWIFQYRYFQVRRGVIRRLSLFVYGVFNGGHFTFCVASLLPPDISGFLKLPYCGADSVDTFPVDLWQSRKGVVPILGKWQHLGQQPLCL